MTRCSDASPRSSTWWWRATRSRRRGAAAHASTASLTVHERFNTATITPTGFSFDLASARNETYSRPGALPTSNSARRSRRTSRRRDFTVNAIAPTSPATARSNGQGRATTSRTGVLQVLHERIVHRRPDADAAARPLRRPAGLQHRREDPRADRPAPDGHGDRRPARQRDAARAPRAAHRVGAARAHRPRRRSLSAASSRPSTTACKARWRSPRAARRSRASGSTQRIDHLGFRASERHVIVAAASSFQRLHTKLGRLGRRAVAAFAPRAARDGRAARGRAQRRRPALAGRRAPPPAGDHRRGPDPGGLTGAQVGEGLAAATQAMLEGRALDRDTQTGGRSTMVELAR